MDLSNNLIANTSIYVRRPFRSIGFHVNSRYLYTVNKTLSSVIEKFDRTTFTRMAHYIDFFWIKIT